MPLKCSCLIQLYLSFLCKYLWNLPPISEWKWFQSKGTFTQQQCVKNRNCSHAGDKIVKNTITELKYIANCLLYIQRCAVFAVYSFTYGLRTNIKKAFFKFTCAYRHNAFSLGAGSAATPSQMSPTESCQILLSLCRGPELAHEPGRSCRRPWRARELR